jgi:aspartyl-tRNA(Asn)/glutamyl-tRNA(Gln) amidotransferase subunit C
MSNSLSADDVRKVATLARLKLTDAEIELLSTQLSRVLDYVVQLDEVDTENVEPMAHAVERTNVFRDDEPRASLDAADALANAPKTDGRFYLVPPILEGG